MSFSGGLSGVFAWVVVSCGVTGLTSGQALAQIKAAPSSATVSVVMLSDLHLDPFHDPAKVPLLVKAPVEEWEAILNASDSADQLAEFAAVQQSCKGKRSVDAPYVLLSSALQAANDQAPDARFAVVSGDLLAHNFDCRYRAAMKLPKAAQDDQSVSAAFAEKTTVFVMRLVERRFKHLPVYFALGNNDSRCNHNRLDVRDAYLKATGPAAIDGLAGASSAEREQALGTYESAGYYAVTLAAPMKRTRLLVLDDVYMMSNFSTCEGDAMDRKGADEQTAWLEKELDSARKHGEPVWVMGHLPPGVNALGTLAKWRGTCGNGGAETYLSSDALETALTSHADVVRLALFGHTHMDELHLLGNKASGVPVKVVASITPVDGNLPSFTVGKVAPASATLMDFTVFVASNPTGVGTTWTKEYGFRDTYHEGSYSATDLEDLIARMRADTEGTGAEAQAYQRYFYKGMNPIPLGPLWEKYVCSLDQPTAEGFKACACGTR